MRRRRRVTAGLHLFLALTGGVLTLAAALLAASAGAATGSETASGPGTGSGASSPGSSPSSTSTQPNAGGATTSPPAGRRPPTRLWYRIQVQFTGTMGSEVDVIRRFPTGEIGDEQFVQISRTTRWTVRTNEAVLIRIRPGGDFTFLSNGAASGTIAHSGTRRFKGFFGGDYPGTCEFTTKEELSGPTDAELSMHGGTAKTSGLSVALEAVTVTQRTPGYRCATDVVGGDPFRRHVVDEPATNVSTVCCLVGPSWNADGYGASVHFGLGGNFGRGSFTRTVRMRDEFKPKPRRDPVRREEKTERATSNATYVIRFERCPGTAPC